MLLRLFITFLICLLLPHFSLADMNTSLKFYSETLSDSRIDGTVNESRLRIHFNNILPQTISPYLAVNYSQDLTNGRAPILTENAVSPGVGLQIKPLPFLYFFSEFRRLYRFDINNSGREASENEFRFGAFAYDYRDFSYNLFNEFYSEAVSVDRVDPEPVLVAWNKFGVRYLPQTWLRTDVFVEGFTRQTPNLGYGPLENELRVGGRLTFLKGFWAASFVVNYAFISNVKVNGVDGLFVLSREAF